jgi:hypothetical protein
MPTETIPYDKLVQSIGDLEAAYGGNSTQSPSGIVPWPATEFVQPTGGNVQFFSVDWATRYRDLSVVVALGANYSQRAGQLPKSSPLALIENGPFVEAELNQWKTNLENGFRAYREKRFPRGWKPGESDRWLTLYSEEPLALPANYHFVMANFCPWITTTEWSNIRPRKRPYDIGKLIMDNPPLQHPHFEEFHKLRKAVPENTLWVGHGNYDIHALFMELVERFGLRQWMFSSNLTYPMMNRGKLAFSSNCMDELLRFFKNNKDKFGYFRINLVPGQRVFDLIWRFPIRDHSHGAFGQNEPRQSEESPEVGLRWEWRDVGHFFKEEGPLLSCAYVMLNPSQGFNLEEEDLLLLREEGNPWLYVNTDNLREIVKEYAVNPILIKRLREGTSRGKQISDAFNEGCYFLGIYPNAEAVFPSCRFRGIAA